MAYKSCVLQGLFALRWGEHPEVQDVETYAAEIRAARRSQGAPLVGLFIMPRDSGAPGEPFRKAQAQKLAEVMSDLAFAIAVFEGDGFFSSLKRSALVAILLLAPKRYPVYVRATIEEALLGNPPKPIAFDARKAIAELKTRQLCS